MIPNIKIEQSGIITRVFIDGNEIHGIRKMSYECDAQKHRVPVIKLDLIATDMTIDSYGIPELPSIFEGMYEVRPQFKESIEKLQKEAEKSLEKEKE